MKFLLKIKLILASLMLIGCSLTASASNPIVDCLESGAPTSLADINMVMQIEKSQTTLTGGYPYKGAVVKHYLKNGKFTAQGTATLQGQVPDSEQYYYGNYKYQRTGFNTAIEKSVDVGLGNLPFTVKYTFDTNHSGQWEENFNNGLLIRSGSFTLEPVNVPPTEQFAPEVKADTSVALIIKSTKSDLPAGVYPTAGLVLQTYAQDGTLVFKGFGPGTLNSTGTYKYTKISANTAVEEVTQVSDFFTLPYTMVYTFDTPTSGKWFQNFGDGLILFSGTFDTFPSK